MKRKFCWFPTKVHSKKYVRCGFRWLSFVYVCDDGNYCINQNYEYSKQERKDFNAHTSRISIETLRAMGAQRAIEAQLSDARNELLNQSRFGVYSGQGGQGYGAYAGIAGVRGGVAGKTTKNKVSVKFINGEWHYKCWSMTCCGNHCVKSTWDYHSISLINLLPSSFEP